MLIKILTKINLKLTLRKSKYFFDRSWFKFNIFIPIT